MDEWSDSRREFYLTTHNTNKKETSMPPEGFESAVPESERPQIRMLEGATTGIGPHFQIGFLKTK
jgi:hypothetical protein